MTKFIWMETGKAFFMRSFSHPRFLCNRDNNSSFELLSKELKNVKYSTGNLPSDDQNNMAYESKRTCISTFCKMLPMKHPIFGSTTS